MGQTETKDLPEMAGRWALFQTTRAKAVVARLGLLTTTHTILARLDIEQSERELSVTWKILDLEVDTGVSAVRTHVSRAVVEAMEVLERPGRLENDGRGGWKLVMPWAGSIIGVELDDRTEPLPTDPDDPRVVDADHDGKPGVTIEFSGLFPGEVYLVQRSGSELESRRLDSDYVEGEVRWDIEQKVLGTKRLPRRLAPKPRPLQGGDVSFFRMGRVDPRAGRDDVLAAARELGSSR